MKRWRRRRAFTLVEAMVVVAIFGIVAVASSMSFVAMLRSIKKGRGALQAMVGTRATLEFVMEEARGAGGPDLPGAARVLIDKGGGQPQHGVSLHRRTTPARDRRARRAEPHGDAACARARATPRPV